jgi:hypothetical protein
MQHTGTPMYPKVQLLIAGQWRDANDGQTLISRTQV